MRAIEPNAGGDFGIAVDGMIYSVHVPKEWSTPALSEKKGGSRTALLEGRDESVGAARSGGDAGGHARELSTHLPRM